MWFERWFCACHGCGPGNCGFTRNAETVEKIRTRDAMKECETDFWVDLEGRWFRKQDNRCIGEIQQGGRLIWDVQWGRPANLVVTKLKAVSGDVLTYDDADAVSWGQVHRHAQAAIHWNNGEVWLRK